MDVSMQEGQRAQLKWQQQPPYELSSQQPQQSCLNETQFSAFTLQQPTMMQQFHDLINNDPAAVQELANSVNGWPELGKYSLPRRSSSRETTMGFISPSPPGLVTDPIETGYYISNTASCSVVEEKGGESVFSVSKKRKFEKVAEVAEDTKEKRTQGDEEVESKVTEQNNNRQLATDTPKDTSKAFDVQKPDYIHVRARRGQATDSHSLAERVRRERISERMKYLQDLVPGCNKITGKAGMLDEIINYVQSLQRQVEFLSMKLAAVNPRPDFNMENSTKKEILPTCTSSHPTMGISSELTNPGYLQFSNSVHEVINSSETTIRRSMSTPMFRMPESFIDSSCFNVQFPSSSSWDTDLQLLYNVEPYQGRSTLFPSQPFTGRRKASLEREKERLQTADSADGDP